MKLFPLPRRFVAIVLALLVVSAGAAVAQDQGRGGRGGPGGGRGGPGGFGGGGGGGFGVVDPTMGLLRVEAVQTELKIDEDQKEALKTLAERARPERPEGVDFRSMGEDERRAFFEKMQKEQREKASELKLELETVLLPEQIERLDEIAMQVRGVQALGDPEIAAKLNITDDQTKKMEEVRGSLREKMQSKMRELFTNRDENTGGNMREAFEEMRKGMEGEILAVLSDSQQKQFEEMKGEPFDMPEDAFGSRGGRGGGRGGPGGGRDGGGRDGGGRGRPSGGERPGGDRPPAN